MSQFTLTPDEDTLVIDALRAKSGQYAAMFGSADPALEALIAKVEGQLVVPEVVPEVVAKVVAEVEARVVAEETPVVAETTTVS